MAVGTRIFWPESRHFLRKFDFLPGRHARLWHPFPRLTRAAGSGTSRPWLCFIPLLVVFLACASSSSAQSVTIGFPLEGHYRVGRYMPVRVAVAADAGATSIALQADGVVTTELPLYGGKGDAVVPWLASRGTIGDANWCISARSKVIAQANIAAELKPLANDERLVAYTDGGLHEALLAAAAIIPGSQIVPLRLDLSRPLLAPPAGYDTIDLLLLGPSAASRVRESAVAVLAAGGTAVAVRSDLRPPGDWPWRQISVPDAPQGPTQWWVLDHPPVGPRSLMDMEAYAPTYGWEHGWPLSVRRRSVLLAALDGIALLGLSLWRSRHAVWAGAALSLIAAGSVIFWTYRQSPLLSAGGALVEWDGSISQRDFWAYRSTLRDTDVSVPWDLRRPSDLATAGNARSFLTKPVFFNALQMRQTGVKLICRPDGWPDHFTAHLVTDATLGILSRSLEPRKPAVRSVDRITPVTPDTAGSRDDDANPALTSPLYVLADQLYPGRVSGRVIEDEIPQTSAAGAPGKPPGEWQTIFIDNEPGQ
jgi:hypothetical protein